MDRLQTMAVFVAVADEAGFAAAARRLNMSPPTVTRAVSDLEARLGARLLHRTTRSVQLTDAGHRYLADCRRILLDIEEADRHAGGVHSSPQGPVSVTGSVMFGRLMLLPALIELHDEYPEITFSTLFVDRVVHLVNEGIDVAVRIAELPDSSLSAVRVGSVRRILCAAPEYLERSGCPDQPGDLADHEIINFTHLMPGGEWTFKRDGKTQHINLQSRLLLNTADAAIEAALAGRGITHVLSYMVAEHLQSGRLKRVLMDYEPAPVPVHIVHKEAGQTSARVRAVVDHLVQNLRGHPKITE